MSSDLKRQADALRRARRTIRALRTLLAEIEPYLEHAGRDELHYDLYQRVRRALHGDKTANNERNDS